MSPILSPNSQSALPTDIFQDFILPDLLSQHLHVLLIDQNPPEWHAFCVLPLVCRSWYYTCQSLFSNIFGVKRRSDGRRAHNVEETEDTDDPDDYDPSLILDSAMSVWQRARHPASKAAHLHQHTRHTLLANKSLTHVYTCLALGKMFLNDDILTPLGAFGSGKSDVDHNRRNAWDEDYEEVQVQSQQTIMDETRLHQCIMPFECAQRLCDFVMPQRLAYVAARYMAQVLPLYHTLPVLMKYSQDLQFNVDREYKLEMEDYATWTLCTLRRLEMTEDLIKSMMNFGTLVRSFWVESSIPFEAFRLTGIISVLDDVVRADWGPDTNDTRRRASALIRRWTAPE